MNFLAHLALAGPSDASLLGNIMADFAKGTREHLFDEFPKEVVEGMLMHRSIDKFTDAHPIFKEASALMETKRRRFAGIVIDIFFDHYLSIHWSKFYSTDLEEFIEQSYQTLAKQSQVHSELFALVLPHMRRENWLGCYGTKDGIKLTLNRVSQRSKYTAIIADCYQDFEDNYSEFEAIFLRIYPDLIEYAKGLAPKR